MSWDRTLWGVEFTGRNGKKILIGSLWHPAGVPYPGEPSRALVFTNRKSVREWCKNKQDKRFRPVRVWETVRKV